MKTKAAKPVKDSGPSPLARAAEKPVKPEMDQAMMDHQAEMDARKLMDAHEVHSDKKRHTAAMAHLGKQKKKITSVEQLKQHYQAMVKEEKDEGEPSTG